MAEDIAQSTTVGLTGFGLKQQHIVQVSSNLMAGGVLDVIGKVEVSVGIGDRVTHVPVDVVGLAGVRYFKLKGRDTVHRPLLVRKIYVGFVYPVFITGREHEGKDTAQRQKKGSTG